MNNVTYCNTHLHSTYSLGDATSLIKEIPKRAAALKQVACALTDHGTMAGVIEFNKECHKNSIKPILGIEAYIAFKDAKLPVSLENPNGHIVLLARNLEGYRNLCKLIAIASSDAYFSYVPRIDLSLLAQYNKGLIASTACIGGIPQKCILGWSYYDPKIKARVKQPPLMENLDSTIDNFKQIFEKDCFYLEVQNHSIAPEEYVRLSDAGKTDYDYLRNAQIDVAKHLLNASKRLDVPAIITNDCHYLNKEDRDRRQAIIAIKHNNTMENAFEGELSIDSGEEEEVNSETKVVRELTGQMYLKSTEEMLIASHSNHYPELVRNTEVIASMCEDYSFDVPKNEDGTKVWNLPAIDTQGENLSDFFRKIVYIGFEERFPNTFEPEDSKQFWKTKSYKDKAIERLEYELSIMKKLRLEGYHLIVKDVVDYAKENSIRVGPGRGSASGSLVVYCLGITDLDPIRHALLFSRYLNADRVASAADIDVDYDPIYVEQIYNHIIEKYGRDNVCKIATYGSLHAKGSIRDLGRVMNLDKGWIKELSDSVPADAGDARAHLSDLLKNPTPSFKTVASKFIETSGEKGKRFLTLAADLDDIKNKRGQHAAGVIISGTPLSQLVPLVIQDREDPNSLTCEIEYDHLEDLGLLKQDLLVVDGLSIIDKTIKLIGNRYDLPKERDELYNDVATYKTFQNGILSTIWQMSGTGIRTLCVNLKPDSLSDIATICALYRPGPLDFIDPETGINMANLFVERKHGRIPVKYDHPALEKALKDTYGVIVYQEQIMQISKDICGWTDAQADYLRKAVGKKEKAGIEKQKSLFIPDAIKHSKISTELADKIWRQLETFGLYGFNMSHSFAYGKLSYQMAYLKTNYPLQYYCSAIDSCLDKNNAKKLLITLHDLITEANYFGIKILAPDIFKSKDCVTCENGNLRLGFSAVENIASTAEKIKTVAINPEMDFCSVVKELFAAKFNKKHITYLIKANAFEYYGNMNMLIDATNKLAELRSKKSKKKMDEFFKINDDIVIDKTITTSEKEKSNNILEALGLCYIG